MHINADFALPVFITPQQYQWVLSTQSGVERMMLDRIGAEKARATSIVKYAPESVFPQHAHPGGEEILVLSGTFSDQSGDYPAGWYLRNPPGTAHSPHSKSGATIFVKLWQMGAADTETVRINTLDAQNWRQADDGRQICPLYDNGLERVSLQKLNAQQPILAAQATPSEWLILAGDVRSYEQIYGAGSWIRLPAGHVVDLMSGPDGVTFYVKQGEFANIEFATQY